MTSILIYMACPAAEVGLRRDYVRRGVMDGIGIFDRQTSSGAGSGCRLCIFDV